MLKFSRTALAESELVYKHDHKSLSVFVSARLVEVPAALEKIISFIKPGAGINDSHALSYFVVT